MSPWSVEVEVDLFLLWQQTSLAPTSQPARTGKGKRHRPKDKVGKKGGEIKLEMKYRKKKRLQGDFNEEFDNIHFFFTPGFFSLI